jgi:hypothetical protein
MKILLLLLLTAGVLLSGCSKEEPAPKPGEAVPAPVQTPEPAAPAPAESTVDLQTINQALKKFAQDKKRVPPNLDELVQAGYLPRVPKPPLGKRFAIDPNKVEVRIEGYPVGF